MMLHIVNRVTRFHLPSLSGSLECCIKFLDLIYNTSIGNLTLDWCYYEMQYVTRNLRSNEFNIDYFCMCEDI